MILCLFFVFWGMVAWWAYFYVFYRPRSVANKRVLITGGGSGIGRLMALRFAKQGAEVILWDVNAAGLKESAEAIQSTGGKCSIHTVDITKRELVYQVAKEVGDIDILINNAGIVTGKSFLECEDEKMVQTMNVNTISHFWTLKAFLPRMLERNEGHVVGIASAAGLVGTAGLVDYCASKFGAVGIYEALYMELRKRRSCKVLCTTVCPFYIKTGMFEGAKSKYPALLPLLEPEWVANRIVLGVQRGEEVLNLPWFINTSFLTKILPVPVQLYMSRQFGLSETMDDFKGRASESKKKQ